MNDFRTMILPESRIREAIKGLERTGKVIVVTQHIKNCKDLLVVRDDLFWETLKELE